MSRAASPTSQSFRPMQDIIPRRVRPGTPAQPPVAVNAQPTTTPAPAPQAVTQPTAPPAATAAVGSDVVPVAAVPIAKPEDNTSAQTSINPISVIAEPAAVEDTDAELENIIKEVNTEQDTSESTKPHPKAHGPVMVAVVALVVAVMLGAIAYFTFSNTQKTGYLNNSQHYVVNL